MSKFIESAASRETSTEIMAAARDVRAHLGSSYRARGFGDMGNRHKQRSD